MAKSRVTTNPMYTGGAGGYSFYVRGGEQVIRQRKNNSNYGEGASRTRAQMIRRIRWGNLVNVFKSQRAWQPKAYDSKSKGQTDYNIFMSLNINQATVGFTKEMCEAGCAVIEAYQVSRGSLPPISLTASGSGNNYVTDIKISNAIQGGTTVGQLAADILANNSQFVEGDNIAFVFFRNWKTSRTEWPYASIFYAEITLDTSSSVVINSIPALDNRLSKSTGGFLQASWSSAGEFEPTREVGFVAIHTRKSASMLAVSSQEILMNSNSLVSQFSGSSWDEQCILSYGLTGEVPLYPSFKPGIIQNVTANGVVVKNADVLTGSQDLRVYVANPNDNDVVVKFNDVVYTPLVKGDDYMGFVLGDNGLCRIWIGDTLYMSFQVTGITLPSNIRQYKQMSQSPTIDQSLTGRVNTITEYVNCINYPYQESESLPSFVFRGKFDEQPSEEDFTFNNCEKISVYWQGDSNDCYVKAMVTDDDEPAWIEYNNFIVAVFNYA